MAKNKGIVAAGHPKTAEAAAQILSAGGNAFDSALGAMAVACVAEPVLASLGGGGFLMARSASFPDRPVCYDFFPEAPKASVDQTALDFFPIEADFGDTTQAFHIGMGSIATPGALFGLFAIHKDLGYMPMRDILAPAITAAKEGVIVNQLQADIFAIVAEIYVRSEGLRQRYGSLQGNSTLKAGERFSMPEFSDFLDVLSNEGEDLIRRGEVAQALAESCSNHGGLLGLDDLRSYQVAKRAPLVFEAFGRNVITNPAPSVGGVLIAFGLRLMEACHLDTIRFGTAEHVATLVDVFGATQALRCKHSDSPENLTQCQEILEPGLIASYQKTIDQRRQSYRGTTQISVIDGAGSAASLTISNGEGSGFILPGTGIMLNNMLGEDDVNPRGFHHYERGERLSSMMAPTLVTGPEAELIALGSGGSNRIRTAMVQALYNVLGLDMTWHDSITAPRLHWEEGPIELEPGFPEAAISHLESLEHSVRRWNSSSMFFGGVHAAWQDKERNNLDGIGDQRRGGVAIIAP